MGIAVFLWISFNLHRRQNRRSKVIFVVESNCAGCRRCAGKCSRHVLEMVEDETGIHAAVKYPERCTACEACLDRCKFKALKLIERA
ncbi:MAG: 4Fe-4S dicluster domain-containing protein [Tannerella sp.]|nr:4Fe-4S dicluster domain-containing protein [Tannerella sp.]